MEMGPLFAALEASHSLQKFDLESNGFDEKVLSNWSILTFLVIGFPIWHFSASLLHLSHQLG
jgi:hypothetical protein